MSSAADAFANALDGVLVVSVEQAVAAPYCTSRLREAGARVIKVERPEGDFARGYDTAAAGESAYFVWLNRGKESVCLDLRQAADAAMLERLIARADVFVQNLAPGAMARLGFDSARLRRTYPRLITLDVSGYGNAEAVAHLKAYDLLVQCESGLASITGSPDAPGRVGVSVCDIACGMYAFAGVLQALQARARTGEGMALAVSLFDAVADWMCVPLLQQEAGMRVERVGLNHPTISPYGGYAAADGRQVVFSIQNPREWQRFCTVVLERPDMTADPRFVDNAARLANRAVLDIIISGVFGALSHEAVVARLQAADIAYGSVNELATLAGHPALVRERQMLQAGEVDMVAAPVRVDGHVVPRSRAVPGAGEQSGALRAEFSPHQRPIA
ncbi:MAG: CaiB/BaiF CoA-transferase family protein [Pseudomonadales bacterium]